jgi:hypothetical protein
VRSTFINGYVGMRYIMAVKLPGKGVWWRFTFFDFSGF